ncbi:hypothetical protein TI03_04295, partial [Achromatium sp. WMS1]
MWHSFGLQDYIPIWQAMQHFTRNRKHFTPDELWTLEHTPVYTLGQSGQRKHILNAVTIPVLQTDRGGQVTYHGPGQIIAYILYDLRRAGIGVKTLVNRLEQAVIDLLENEGIIATRKTKAPGVYVADSKIASLGLRVRHGFSFHGLSLNCDMDL